MDNFDIFDRSTGSYLTGDAVVLIAADGSFTLNPVAVRLFGPTPPTHVLLGYNSRRQAVAIFAAKEDDPRSYKLRQPNPGALGRVITAKPFLAYYEISSKRRRYTVTAIAGAGGDPPGVTFNLTQIAKPADRTVRE